MCHVLSRLNKIDGQNSRPRKQRILSENAVWIQANSFIK